MYVLPRRLFWRIRRILSPNMIWSKINFPNPSYSSRGKNFATVNPVMSVLIFLSLLNSTIPQCDKIKWRQLKTAMFALKVVTAKQAAVTHSWDPQLLLMVTCLTLQLCRKSNIITLSWQQSVTLSHHIDWTLRDNFPVGLWNTCIYNCRNM